jgi:hypothetical protein
MEFLNPSEGADLEDEEPGGLLLDVDVGLPELHLEVGEFLRRRLQLPRLWAAGHRRHRHSQHQLRKTRLLLSI